MAWGDGGGRSARGPVGAVRARVSSLWGRGGTDDDWAVARLVFVARAGVLAAVLASLVILPEAADDRLPLIGVVLAVGLPYTAAVAWYSNARRRLPTFMVFAEPTITAVVAAFFPIVWAPMLLMAGSNLALHAVMFPWRTAFLASLLGAAAFAAAGAVGSPQAWTLGVVAYALVGPSMVLVLGTVASRERSARTRFRAMVEGVDVVVLEADPHTQRFTYVSHQVEDFLGYTPEQWLSSDTFWIDHVHPDDARRCVKTFMSSLAEGRDFELEFRMVAADGRIVWIHASATFEFDVKGEPSLIRAVAVDVTERRRAEEALRHQALHDALTGLPNRVLLQERLRAAIASARRRQEPVALLLVDLDQFKEINDTLGHEHGDRLLQQIGARLQRVLRENDTVARLGGDEFAIVVESADLVGAEIVASKIEAALEHPFQLEDMTIQARASVGIALFPEQGSDAETLVQRADVAMYVAKRTGGGSAVYDPSQDRFSVRRLALISDLRRALQRSEFDLYYQPKLDLRTDQIVGVEALLRWRHPEHGLMGPDRFIMLAEVSGLIEQITGWVVDRAVRQCRAWLNAGVDLAVSVNISARDLHDGQLADRIAERLDRWHIPPQRLVIEITEHEIMRDRVQATDTLRRLAEMGVRVSIDDFGTGYSSLADLRQLPIDEIKIDRSFVADMATDVNDAVIVRSIVDLGHNLGINVVAEGVENMEIRGWLDELGCDELQGFDICHPLPAGELETWLRAREEITSPTAIHLDDVASY